MADRSLAAGGPTTSGIVGAVVFWVIAILLSFMTAPVQDVPGWVWALRVILVIAGVGYVIGLIMREISRRNSGAGASRDDTAFDLWTIAHTTAGLVMGAWGVPFILVVIFTIAWEFFEKYVPGFGDKEVFSNRIVDIAVAWVGWIIVAGIVALATNGSTNIAMPWIAPAAQSLVADAWLHWF